MKTFLKLLSLVLAASIPGVAFAEFSPLTSGLFPVQGETLVALFISTSALALAVLDYSRRMKAPEVLATPLRPALPAHRSVRRTSAIVERVA